MIYEVKHTSIESDDKVTCSYRIDDLVFFGEQPKDIQAVLNAKKEPFGNISGEYICELDNAIVRIYATGRVLIEEKLQDDGE